MLFHLYVYKYSEDLKNDLPNWIHKILILTGGVRKTPIPKQENNYTENSLVHK